MNSMKRKLRNWTIGFFLAAVTFLGLAYWAMDTVVDLTLRQMMTETPSVGTEAQTTQNNSTQQTGSTSNQDRSGTSALQAANGSQELNVKTENPPAQQGTSKIKDDSTSFGYRAEVSSDKAQSVQDSVTLDEKLIISSILLDRFSSEELGLFRKLASGGLSIDEKKQMRETFLKKLSPSQYDELILIAKKYGVSQGKSFEEHN